MNYLGKLYWEGWGGDVDEGGAIHYLEKAGKRGHVTAMQSLVNIYKFQGKEYNQLHWQVRLDRALELAASLPLRGSSQRPASQVVDEKTLVVPRRRLRAIPGQSQPQ
jgi:TPR repeat protein